MPIAGPRPYPYDFIFGSTGFLKPPADALAPFRSFAYTNETLPWFPERVQNDSISERLLPPKLEAAVTVRDRTGGFGHTDWPDAMQPGQPGVYAASGYVDGYGQGVDCSVAGTSFLGPEVTFATPVTSAFGGLAGHFELTLGGTRYVFAVVGDRLIQSSDGVTWSTLIPGSATVMPTLYGRLSGRPCVFTGTQASPRVYFPFGAGIPVYLWDGVSATFTALSFTDNNGWIDCAVVEDAVWALWYDPLSKRYRVNKMQDGGATPSWYPSYAITDTSDPAQVLIAAAGKLFVGCRRHLRQIADDLSDLEQTILTTPDDDVNNFKWWTIHQDRELWFNCGKANYRLTSRMGSLSSAAALVLEQVGPEKLTDNRTQVQGTLQARVSDGFCVYSFLTALPTPAFTSTEYGVFLLKHRKYDQYEATHCVSNLGIQAVDYAFVTTVGDGPRLIFAQGADGLIGTIVLPENGFYPPGDTRCRFCSAGSLTDSRQHGDLYFLTKALLAWTGRAQALSSAETIQAAVRVTAADTPTFTTPYAAYGPYSTLVSDPGGRVQVASPIVATAWWENRITLRRGLDASKTPQLLASTTSYNLRPPGKALYTVFVWVADYSQTHAGARDFRGMLDVQQDVLALRNAMGVPMTFIDEAGMRSQVMITDVKLHSVASQADERPEMVARIEAAEWLNVQRGTWGALRPYQWRTLKGLTWRQLRAL